IYKLLPVDTFRGELVRLCYRTLKGKKKIASSIDVCKSSCSSVNINNEYDLIVQVDNFEAGGLENVVLELNEFLMEKGYRVLLLVLGTQGVSVQRARDIGMNVHCMAYSDEAYIDLLQVVKPKIVMTHYSINGVSICHENNIPFIQVIHNLYMWFNPLQKAEFKRAAELTEVFVAVSSAVKKYSVSKLAVPEEKCIVISNGINFEPFDKVDKNISRIKLRAKFSIAEDAFVYIDVGAINHQKNHISVLRAFKSIATKCPNSVLVIIGPAYEPDLLREIEEFILLNDLVDRAYYCGQVKNVDEFLAMSDAFVSGTIFEGGPLTLLEAVKSDLPVIMPNVGLANDFYGKNGFEIIDRAVDIENYDGPIWGIPTRHDYESDLADAMVRVYCNPVKPQLSADEFCNMNKDVTYSKYRELVDTVVSRTNRTN
ncbi:TPA: glycosyltransferase family 4 protein, partial [Aeromonas dhakensis]|nr:glycosyltransferase family 4 protein [Aeromonas dhakensis]